MHRSIPSICVAGALLWTTGASAETLRTFKIANWQAGAYTRQGTSQFNHCAASARYNSGVAMMFAVNRSYTWSMGFSSPEWRLVRGNIYDIAFQIDDGAAISARATAIGTGQVEVQLQDSTSLFNQFRWGQRLRVASAGKVLTFKLTDTSAILPELVNCVKQYVSAAPPQTAGTFFGSPPAAAPVPAPAPAPTPVAVDPGTRTEATTLVANLLAQAGITGFQILSGTDLERLKADAAWRADKVIGTVSVLSGGGLTLDQISGKVIGNAAQSCHGKFFSGSLPDTQDGTTVTRVFTACQREANVMTIYYLGVPRPAGGFYMLTTSAIGSEQPAKEADQNLRSAVYKVLSK